MIDWSWLNVGSLVLGLIAWTLPVVNLMRYKNHNHKNWSGLRNLKRDTQRIRNGGLSTKMIFELPKSV